METTEKKDRNRALAGTLIFHGLLLLCFLLFSLSAPEPQPEDYGVLVALGYEDAGQGDRQPLAAPTPVNQSPPASEASEHEEIVTQEAEEAVALPDEVADPETEQEQVESDREDPVNEPQEETEEVKEEPEPEVDPRALFPGRDQRSTEQRDQGQTEEEGDQGQAEGVLDTINFDGVGQGGIEYSLAGRQANFLPVPKYTTQATGRVVVQVTVNQQGQVIRAEAGARGTTTTDRTLHRHAEEAARRARFDLQADAPEEQRGTITYNFIRLN
ncbi:MAG: TonB family protein [Bacteroidales bacterium]